MESLKEQEWKELIRKVPNFPKEGILFFDVTSIFLKPTVFQEMVKTLAERVRRYSVEFVASVEARGFLFGAPLALELGVPFIPIRKKNKLPGRVMEKRFQLEYGEDVVAVHCDDVPAGGRFLLMDDLIATGGTLKASCEMLEECGATVAVIGGIIGLPFLPYKEVLKDYPIETLVHFESENID